MDPHPPSSGTRPPAWSHRLPTVSASQALLSLQSRGPRSISTGLHDLDALLDTSHRGLQRGKITEVWGPSGSGKTSIALQAATGVLNSGDGVVWVDTARPLATPRLNDFLAASAPKDSLDIDKRLATFHQYSAPAIAHLLALTLHPPPSFPPPRTSLMVIDDLHILFEVAYPRHRANTFSSHKSESAKWTAGRRYGIMASLIAALRKLAAVYDMAIIVTTGCATRMRNGTGLGATLVPGLGGAEWEAGISNRLVMFRDFRRTTWSQQKQGTESPRYVGLQKINGLSFSDDGEIGQLVPFTMDIDGLKDVNKDSTADVPVVSLAALSPSKSRKRVYEEIADSDGEEGRDEYGWLNHDEAAAEGLVDEEALVEHDAHAVPTITIDDD